MEKKEMEIKNMVAILKQIDLPGILLLTRDANTLLMRQIEADVPRAHLSVNKIENGYAECDVRIMAVRNNKKETSEVRR